jgi:hypothetical protein
MAVNQAALFNTVPAKDIGKFFKNGEVDGQRVVEFLKYKKEDVAVASGIPMPSIRYDSKMPVDLRERMVEWATAINLVGSHFNDLDKTILWFQVPNPLLGSLAPRDLIRVGRFKKLLKFIQTALDENKR